LIISFRLFINSEPVLLKTFGKNPFITKETLAINDIVAYANDFLRLLI
jgi:hypothetical protein